MNKPVTRAQLRQFRNRSRIKMTYRHVAVDRRQCRRLFMAILLGHDSTRISQLLAAGANPNVFNYENQMPLQLAVLGGNFDVIRVLIEAGAKIGVVRDAVCSGVMPFAARHATPQVMRFLLSLGGDPMARNYGGSNYNMSAVHAAARHGCKETLRVMLEAGGDASMSDSEGWSPARLVVHEAFVIAQKTSPLRPNPTDDDWLDYIDFEKIQCLRDFGYDINEDPPLLKTMLSDHRRGEAVGAAISMGLSSGAKLHVLDPSTKKFRWVPVMDALALSGHVSGYVEALRGGMEPCVAPEYLRKLVVAGVRRGDIGGLQDLGEAGVFSRLDLHALSLDVFSDAVSMIPKDGDSSHTRLLDALESWGFDCNVDGGLAAASAIATIRPERKTYAQVVDWFLVRSPNALGVPVREDGLSAMHFAAAKGDVEFMKFLVSRGADPAVESFQGERPLKLALECKQLDAVIYLSTVTKTDLKQPLWGKKLFDYFNGRRGVPKEEINYLKVFVASQEAMLAQSESQEVSSPHRRRGLSL